MPSINRSFPIMVFGSVVGLGVLLLVDKDLRWIVAALLALAGAVFMLVVQEKKKVLTIVFILSFQINIILRLFHGHSGSAEGIGLPLVVLTGAALAGWYYFSGNAQDFSWGGSLRGTIAALIALLCTSTVTSSERFVGIGALIFALEYYFLYWLAFNISRTYADFQRIIVLLLVVLGTQSLVYFVQSLLGITFDFLGNVSEEGTVPRPGGTVSTNPDGFVSFMFPALMIASALAFSKQRRVSNAFVVPIMFLGVAAIGLSYTRAAWIGLVFGFLAIVIFGIKNKWIKVRMVFAVTAVATVGIIGLLPKMFDRVSSDYGKGGVVDGAIESFNERMGLNRIAFNIISNSPLFGVGPGAYSYVYKSYVPSGMNQWLFTVHNEYLLRAAETGVPGAIAFICLLIGGLRIALRLSRGPPTLLSICASGWYGAIIVLMWMMFWVPWNGFAYNAMFWFMLGLMDGAQRLIPYHHKANSNGPKQKPKSGQAGRLA